jgi:lysophospholipase L1-like esterase
MQKITLLGDSIRLAYQPLVAQHLASRAEVWGPEENGEFSVKLLVYLPMWVWASPPDVLHLNCGLHDIKTVTLESRENLVPLPFYRRNLDLIFGLVRERLPQTRLIWATTTPVVSDYPARRVAQNAAFSRCNEDIDAYNAAVGELCALHGVEINDLNAKVKACGADALLSEDGVHFSEDGNAFLAKCVAEFLTA